MSTLNKKAHRLPLASMSNEGFTIRANKRYMLRRRRRARKRQRTHNTVVIPTIGHKALRLAQSISRWVRRKIKRSR